MKHQLTLKFLKGNIKKFCEKNYPFLLHIRLLSKASDLLKITRFCVRMLKIVANIKGLIILKRRILYGTF